MGFCYADRLKVVNTNPGIGNFSGGSGVVAGFQSFANAKLNGTGAVAANGDVIPYAAWDGGSLWEVGYATYTLSGVLLGRSAGNVTAGSSGAGALVVFSGSVTVWCGVPAKSAVVADSNGNVSLGGNTSGDALGVTKNQNAASAISILNTDAGVNATAQVGVSNGTKGAQFIQTGVNWTGLSGAWAPGDSALNSSSGWVIQSGGAVKVAVAGSTTEVLRVGTDGSFLVNTTANGGWLGVSKAEVKTTSGSGVALSAWNSAGSGNGSSLLVRADFTGTTLVNFFYTGATNVGSITTNGTSTTYGTSSDETLKNILAQQRDFGVMIDVLWVGDAAWKSDPEQKPCLMVTAQRTLAAGYDQAIHTRPDGMMEADYGQFSPLALWGVKELRPRVKALEEEVAELRALVKALLAKG